MKFEGTLDLLQTIFIGFGLVISLVTLIIAYKIGLRQNEINEQALNISNFVEIFIMPQQVVVQDHQDPKNTVIKWNILIKNVSSYPIYLNNFSLNGVKRDVGNSAIPNNSDSWYAIPIPQDIQDKKEFSMSVDFEDYLGANYESEAIGQFDGITWQIKSKKRVVVKK